MRKLARIIWAGLTSAMLLNIGAWPGCELFGPTHDEAGALLASADQLRATVVTPHPEAPIAEHTNVLWCGTFQLAWNAACKLAGGQLRFAPPQPEMAAILNKKNMTAADIDSGSYIAEAGYVRDGIYARIEDTVRGRFGGNAPRKLKPNPEYASRPQDIVAYSYLHKNLRFPTPFERIDDPLRFGDAKISCFGMARYKPGHDLMAKQVSIIDYRSPDDFVIELTTGSPGDRLILAKMASGKTLAVTIDALVQRIAASTPIPALPEDVLEVPKMNFDITRQYRELTGRRLIATAPGMASDLTLQVADQDTRFQMDEKGVELWSESRMEFGCSAEPPPPEPEHIMVFDKPFLLMMIRADRKIPYFALWVGNADLLVHASR